MDTLTKKLIRERLASLKERIAEAPEKSRSFVAAGESQHGEDRFNLTLGYARSEGFLLGQLLSVELEIDHVLRLLGNEEEEGAADKVPGLVSEGSAHSETALMIGALCRPVDALNHWRKAKGV